ncbi:MAG: extracellular solute-binding protein [Lachnospiraceae bacterium]|nr:extracellular solute-binding protein [Lachnospiraceae bacterium]
MKKKFCALLAILMVLAAVFSACSKPGASSQAPAPSNNSESQQPAESTKEPAPPAEEGYDGSAVTIKFYHTMGQNLNTILDEYLAEFKELYPNITVEWTQVGGYNDVRDQIKTEITVGNQPNIAYCYPDHVALYNKADAVQTLDEFISSKAEIKRADGTTEIMGLTDEQIADFIEGYYNEGKAFGDGLMYTMPFSKSTEVMYYNKTFFDKNGLKVPATWDEMYEVAKKIKQIDPDSTPVGYDSSANWFITLCEQYGSPYTSATGNHYLFDNDVNRGFAEKLNGWYREGILTTQKLYGSYTSNMFKELKSYISIGSSAGATYQRPDKADGAYPFEVGIAPIPQIDPSNPKAISQGPSVCIFKKENMQEVYASWLLVKYLTTSVPFQADFSRVSGYMPVIKSVDQDEIFAKFLKEADGGDYIAALSVKVGLEQEKAYFVSPAFVGSSVARDQVDELLNKCLGFTEANGSIADQIKGAFEEAVEECEYQS